MDKINFVNNSAPALSAENLNQLQENIENALIQLQTIINNAKLDKTGGTMTGTLNTRSLIPTTNGSDNLGSSSNFYNKVYVKELQFDNSNSYRLDWANGKLQFFVNGTLVKEL